MWKMSAKKKEEALKSQKVPYTFSVDWKRGSEISDTKIMEANKTIVAKEFAEFVHTWLK